MFVAKTRSLLVSMIKNAAEQTQTRSSSALFDNYGYFRVVPSMLTERVTPELVIFDKDGTLLCFHTMWVPWIRHAIENIEKATNMVLFPKIASALGLCLIENKVKPGLLAEGTTNQIAREISNHLQDNGVRYSEASRLAHASLKYSSDVIIGNELVKELSDTAALFNHLKQHGTKIAVCTADNRKSSMLALKSMNVTHLVDMVVCGDDKNTLPKPHPHNALKICQYLGVDPSKAIMVGDTRVDLEMAHNAQLGAAVGVLSGVGCRHHLHRADVLLENVGHIVDTFYDPS